MKRLRTYLVTGLLVWVPLGITLFLVRMDDPGLTIHPMPTMGGERTNGVFFDDVFVHDDYRVGELNKGFQYIAEALDIERFTLFTFSPIRGRMQVLADYVKTATRDGKPLKDDPIVRQRLAQLIKKRGGRRAARGARTSGRITRRWRLAWAGRTSRVAPRSPRTPPSCSPR